MDRLDIDRCTKTQAVELELENSRPLHAFNRPKAALRQHLHQLLRYIQDAGTPDGRSPPLPAGSPSRQLPPLAPTRLPPPGPATDSSPQGTGIKGKGNRQSKIDPVAELDLLGRLIAELACSAGQWISYSRKAEWYSARIDYGMLPASCTRNRMVRIVDKLRTAGLVDHVGGYKLKGVGYQSMMRPTVKLLAWAASIDIPSELCEPDPAAPVVIVKDAKGNPVLPANHREFEAACRKVAELREWMRSFVVSAPAQTGNYELWQGFNSAEMDKGGRYYGWWQNLTKQQRLDIRLNREPVVELDFKTLHPSMLYHRRGIHPPANAYTVDGFSRELVKQTFNRMLNSKNLSGTRRTLGEELGSRGRADTLIDALLLIHKPLADDDVFGSGAGLELMRQDAEIAVHVMRWAQWSKTPMLPVHDSFIVRQREAELCDEHMRLIYHAYFGIEPNVQRSEA